MSLEYTVVSAGVDIANILAPFVDNLDCEEADLLEPPAEMEGPMAEGVFFHLFIPGVSTRSVEVGFEGGQVFVKSQMGAAPADYVLARDIAAQAAVVGKSSVRVVDDEYSFRDLDAFRQAWNVERLREHCRWEIRALVTALTTLGPEHTPDQVRLMRLACPVRDFIVGPRLLEEMQTEAGDQYDVWLHERMLAAQWPDVEHVEAPIMVDEEAGYNMAVWLPGDAHVLPDADYYAVCDGPSAYDDTPLGDALIANAVMVPRNKLTELMGAVVTWLDETTALVPPISAEDWPAHVARARQFHSPPRSN